ncbi:pentapeptide repeat-containing protein [Candidatus Gracilibacteria bacterium]|nr:pentapeptide repeat-containing protein [Candidatus Gracilibacteria bacterium]
MMNQEHMKNKVKPFLISKKIIFYLVSSLLGYFIFYLSTDIWNDIQVKDMNFVNEILGIVLALGLCIYSYFKIYKQHSSFKLAENKKKQVQIDKAEAKADSDFLTATRDFKNAKTLEEKELIIETLSTIALDHSKHRQACVNYLASFNDWMLQHKNVFINGNLVTWLLKGKYFEKLPIESQKLSIKAIIKLEQIIKKHCKDIQNNFSNKPLDLSSKCIPALNLGFTIFPKNAIMFNFGFFWKSSFWETTLHETNFTSAELQECNFWKAKLYQVNFNNTNLNGAKLKTDLKLVKNLSSTQFFSSTDWHLCLLSEEQLKEFLPNHSSINNPIWEKWTLGDAERKRLFKEPLL